MRLSILLLLLAACEPQPPYHVNVPCGAVHPIDPKYGQDVCPRKQAP